jgi:hypothetical protein
MSTVPTTVGTIVVGSTGRVHFQSAGPGQVWPRLDGVVFIAEQ